MKTIKLSKTKDSIGTQLKGVFDLIKICSETEDKEICFDFCNTSFIHPVFICCFKSFLEENPYNLKMDLKNYEKIHSYLDTIKFFNSIECNQEELDYLNTLNDKSYIPIFKFPLKNNKNTLRCKEKIISSAMDIIVRNVANPHYQNAIQYLIGELTDNIIEHSDAINGFIFAQHFRNKNFIDICIVDLGITIKGSYNKVEKYNVENDYEAISLAFNGHSTKELDGRGTGIPTTSNIIINVLGGKFVIVSGGGMLFNNELIKWNSTLWPGTAITIRIPDQIDEINLYDYL